jgi:hypothetical protein
VNRSVSTGNLVGALIGALVIFIALWMTHRPVSATQMQEYVELTVIQRLDRMEVSMRDIEAVLINVRERLAGIEALLPKPG